MNDSPLNLTYIEEYRKQKGQLEDLQWVIDTNGSIFSNKWRVILIAKIPSGKHITSSELINPDAPFLRWRLKLAKRRLLKQWRIVCEMES